MTLYHLASNQSLSYKCEKKWFDKVKVNKNDLIIATFKTKEKMKYVGYDPIKQKDMYAKTGEYENIVKMYQVIKE